MRLVVAVPLLVVSFMTRPVWAQSIVAGPVASQVLADTNVRVTIPIAADLTGAPNISLGAYRLTFNWNPARFAFAGVSVGTFGTPVFNIDSAAGSAQFAAVSATGDSGLINLGNVSLKVLDIEPDSFTVAFSELRAARTFDDLLPLLTVTSMTFCKGSYHGDVDGDRVIGSTDALIVLMHSVGIDTTTAGVPLDVTAGDVDGDGDVDPRDALGIVSHAVQLVVPNFRIATLFGPNCLPSVPASVSLPSSIELAPGDAFSLLAEVKSATGRLVGARRVQFSSNDTTVVVVDGNGVLLARAVGTATLTAAISPGVTATTAVTVGQRHIWRVDPAIAETQSREIGSRTHPFSTIEQALDRAADGDTVSIAVAFYTEPISTTKSLVFVGDSTAAGMPTISTPHGPAGTITASRVFITRLQFVESAAGLRIKADSVGLQSVAFRAIRGIALNIDSTTNVGLRRVSVDGAIGIGILVDHSQRVGILSATVRGIGEGGSDVLDSLNAGGGLDDAGMRQYTEMSWRQSWQ